MDIRAPYAKCLTSGCNLLCAAEKASIYTWPGAILPVLTPLMRVLAYLFPDKGITNVRRAPRHARQNMTFTNGVGTTRLLERIVWFSYCFSIY